MTHRRQRYLFLICSLALGIAIAFSAGYVEGPAVCAAQTVAPRDTTGKIVGSIKPRLVAYSVSLSALGVDAPSRSLTVDSSAKFVLEDIQPGTYTLTVEIFNPPFGHCGFSPWSREITVHASETVRARAKLKAVPDARCE